MLLATYWLALMFTSLVNNVCYFQPSYKNGDPKERPLFIDL